MIIEDQLRGLGDIEVTVPVGLARKTWERGQRRRRCRTTVAAGVTTAALAGASLGGVALAHTVSASAHRPAPSLGSGPGRSAPTHPGRSQRIPRSCSDTNGSDPLWNPSTTLSALVKDEPAVAAELDHVSLAMPVPGLPQRLDPRTRSPFTPGQSTSPLAEDQSGPACGPFRNLITKTWLVGPAERASAALAPAERSVQITVLQHRKDFMTLNPDGTFGDLHDPVLGHLTVRGAPALLVSPDHGSPAEKMLLFTDGSVDVMVYSISGPTTHGYADHSRMSTASLVAIADRLHGLPQG